MTAYPNPLKTHNMGQPTYASVDITNSSNIARVEYFQETKVLRITFKRGRSYKYKDVPRKIFDELIAAESVGTYFAKHIRNEYETEEG